MGYAVPARSYPHTFSWRGIAAKARGVFLFSGRGISGRGGCAAGGRGRFRSRQKGRSRACGVSARGIFSDAYFGMPGRGRICRDDGASFTDGAAVVGGGGAGSAFSEAQTRGAHFSGTGNNSGEDCGVTIRMPTDTGQREAV